MSFTLDRFASRRPYLFHVMCRQNVENLQAARVLFSASTLATQAGRPDVVATPRETTERLRIHNRVVTLRDQKPLHVGHVRFEGGWRQAELLAALAEHVFFWPGTEEGPVRCGWNHFKTYADTDVILRIPFNAVADQDPYFCRFNSGAPRCSGGRKSPRGPETFSPAARCPFQVADVVEVVFRGGLRLPDDAELANTPGGPWRPFKARGGRRRTSGCS